MTKQDFVFIAGVLKGSISEPGLPEMAMWRFICLEFARELKYTNPRFDREKFLVACGFAEQEL